jgi:predicted HTH transcriptional regulator
MRADIRDKGHYIKDLIQAGENQQLDFKFEISDAKKIARTFSAFANTDGGRLLIGVKDNGKISGIKSDEEAYMAESAAHLFCKPAVPFKCEKWFVDGRCILEIEIPVSTKRPHYAKNETGEWTAYVRVGDQNMQANKILIEVWKHKGKENSVWMSYGKEEKVLLAYLTEHKRITLSRFMKVARITRTQAEEILVNLILIHIISMEMDDMITYYRLIENN